MLGDPERVPEKRRQPRMMAASRFGAVCSREHSIRLECRMSLIDIGIRNGGVVLWLRRGTIAQREPKILTATEGQWGPTRSSLRAAETFRWKK